MRVMVIHFPDKGSCVKCEEPITGEMGYVKMVDGAVCWFCRPKKKTTRQSGPEVKISYPNYNTNEKVREHVTK